MTEYVLGFCFNAARTSVVLIRKNRPKWQAGRLNAVGGHIEPGENYFQAIQREFHEETGVLVDLKDWNYFALIHGIDWQKDSSGQTAALVYCFETASDLVFEQVRSTTDEEIVRWNIAYTPMVVQEFITKLIPNLHVLIPLACSTEYQRPISLPWSQETKEHRREEALKNG